MKIEDEILDYRRRWGRSPKALILPIEERVKITMESSRYDDNFNTDIVKYLGVPVLNKEDVIIVGVEQ